MLVAQGGYSLIGRELDDTQVHDGTQDLSDRLPRPRVLIKERQESSRVNLGGWQRCWSPLELSGPMKLLGAHEVAGSRYRMPEAVHLCSGTVTDVFLKVLCLWSADDKACCVYPSRMVCPGSRRQGRSTRGSGRESFLAWVHCPAPEQIRW